MKRLALLASLLCAPAFATELVDDAFSADSSADYFGAARAVAGGVLTPSADGVVLHDTATTGNELWGCQTFGNQPAGSSGTSIGDASGNGELFVWNVNGGNLVGEWISEYDAPGDSYVGDDDDPALTLGTYNGANELCYTVDLATNIVRFWNGVTADSEPVSLTDWNGGGDSADDSYDVDTNASHALGQYLGVGSWNTGTPTDTYTRFRFGIVGGADLDQFGFRWGVDDNNEATHTFEANENTDISIADNQSRLIRIGVEATTGDPAALAYTLRYQKNGSGGYVAVPVGANPTSTINNQNVAASADDAAEATAGTVVINGTTIGASLDATTEWVGMRFTNMTIPAGATITTAYVRVVPSGTGEDEPLVTLYFQDIADCAAFTTGANDISSRARTTANASWSSADLGANGATYFQSPSLVTALQEVIDGPASGGSWASGNDLCVIIQGGATTTRDLTIEAQDLGPNTNPPQIFIDYTSPAQVYITTSANISASGENTTNRLTDPGNDFVTGRRWDDENGTDTIDITDTDFSEFEWLVFIASSAADGDFFDFRVYAGSTELDTYTDTPRWTIPSAGGTQPPRTFHQFQQQRRAQP